MDPVNTPAAIGTKRPILFVSLNATIAEAGTRGLVVDVKSSMASNIQFPSVRGRRAGHARDWCLFHIDCKVENRFLFIVGIEKRMDFLLGR